MLLTSVYKQDFSSIKLGKMDKDMIGMHKELLLPHRLPHVLQKHGAHKGPKILHNQLNLKQLPLNHIIKAIRLIIVGENLISKVETQVGD
jgi:hypothetical protein